MRRVAARAKEVVVVGRIVGRWIIGFVEVRRRSFFGQDGRRFLTCLIEWMADLANLLFVNECLEGEEEEEGLASNPLARRVLRCR